MSKELEVAERFDSMNRVVEELLKGNNPTQIAKILSIKRATVLELIEDWKNIVHNDNSIHVRAREALAAADQHYAMIINRAWETVEQADSNQQYSVKAGALKLVADTEAKRMDMLNRAGLLENNEMADKIIDNERKQALLMGILRDVSSQCDHCKYEVAQRLSQVTNQVEVIRED